MYDFCYTFIDKWFFSKQTFGILDRLSMYYQISLYFHVMTEWWRELKCSILYSVQNNLFRCTQVQSGINIFIAKINKPLLEQLKSN